MKTPRNHSLAFAKWPIKDQQAWDDAMAPGNVLEGSGPASHWADQTKVTNARSYGRWLAFLEKQGLLDPAKEPSERVTQASVRAYIDRLKATTAPVSVASSIIGLLVVLKAMVPQEDWTWLGRASNALKRNAKPSRDKRSRMLPSSEIYSVALGELKRLSTAPLDARAELVGFRNALMLAVITPCPLRLKNFAALELGRDLVRIDGNWSIQISATQVKNRRSIEFELPRSLTQFIEQYIVLVRPYLLKKRNSDALWINGYGSALTAHAIYLRMMKFTKKLLGKPINPHLFRDCAATTLATTSSAAALAARDLLGHSQFSTTEKYYIQGQHVEASRQISEVLETF